MMTVIVDRIGEVVESMRNLSAKDADKFGIEEGLESPYYFYGHPMDVNKQLISRDQEILTNGKCYPAIVLRLPVAEEIKNGIVSYNLNIAIFAVTDLNWNTQDRYTNVIKPVLIPLYELFLDRLKKSKFFWEGDQSRPPHTKIDRPHHGVNETQGNKAYVFQHKLDAIELTNLKINSHFKFC